MAARPIRGATRATLAAPRRFALAGATGGLVALASAGTAVLVLTGTSAVAPPTAQVPPLPAPAPVAGDPGVVVLPTPDSVQPVARPGGRLRFEAVPATRPVRPRDAPDPVALPVVLPQRPVVPPVAPPVPPVPVVPPVVAVPPTAAPAPVPMPALRRGGGRAGGDADEVSERHHAPRTWPVPPVTHGKPHKPGKPAKVAKAAKAQPRGAAHGHPHARKHHAAS